MEIDLLNSKSSYASILEDVYKTFYFLSNLRKIIIDYRHINPTNNLYTSGFMFRCSSGSFSKDSKSTISDMLTHILESDNVALLLSDDILEDIILLLFHIYDVVVIYNYDDIIKEELVNIILLHNTTTVNYLLNVLELFYFITNLIKSYCPTIYTEASTYFNNEDVKQEFANNVLFSIDIFDNSKFNLDSMKSNLEKLYDFLLYIIKYNKTNSLDTIFKIQEDLNEMRGGKKILKYKKIIKKLKKYIK